MTEHALTLVLPSDGIDALAERVAAQVAATVRASFAREPWRLLTLPEAADRLGRSERWVRERVKRGDLMAVRLDGGALAFELEDLRSFAADRRVGGRRLTWRS